MPTISSVILLPMKATKKQTELLSFIDKFTEENNYSPSYREIMRALNLNSVSAVAQHIDNCVEAGLLEKVPHAARSLRVIEQSDYKETKALFVRKIKELEAAREEHPNRKRQIDDDIMTLRAAANLLKLEIML